MMHEQGAEGARPSTAREGFLARFDRVSSGLDPDQVFAMFFKVLRRVEQVEEQAKRTSAPFVMEATLREAATLCSRATEASERAYEEIVRAAEQEAERLAKDAQRRGGEIVQTAEDQAAEIRARAEQQAASVIEQARREAAELRRAAAEAADMAQSMLDEARRYSPEPPAAPSSRLSDDRPLLPPERGPRPAPLVGPGDDWPRADAPRTRPIASRLSTDPEDDFLAPPASAPLAFNGTDGPPQRTAPSAPPSRSEEGGPFRLPDWLDV